MVSLGVMSLCHTSAQNPEEPPWKRVLKGDAAKRVAELDQQVRNLYESGRYSEGIKPAREAFEIRSRELGPTHWHTVNTKNSLDLFVAIAALPKSAQDELTSARKLEKGELLKLWEKGQYGEALAVAERLVAIRQRYLPNDCSLVATTLNQNAILCNELAQYSKAEKLLRQVLSIGKKVYGDGHPDFAATLGNLAISLDGLDRFQEAHEAKDKALEIYLSANGEESDSVALAYSNLGGSFEREGYFGKAETHYRKAIGIFERLGADKYAKNIATARDNLAGALNHQAKYAEAEHEFQEVLKLETKLYGEDHPNMAFVYNNLGVCLADQHKYAAAEPLYRKALEIRTRVYGEDHILTLQTYSNLALVLNHRGNLAWAERLLRRALYLTSAQSGKESLSAATWYNSLAHNLKAQGRHAESKEALEQGLAILRRFVEEDHPSYAAPAIDLAVTLSDEDKYEEAEPLFDSAVKALQKHLGEKHPFAMQAHSNHGGNLYYLGKFALAEAIHVEVLADFQRIFGENHPQTSSAFRNLIIDLWAEGRYAKAREYAAAAAKSYEGARRQSAFTGLERSGFAGEWSPLPLLAILAARDGDSLPAWQFLENGLARGLLDDLSARPWTDEERQRELKLLRESEQLDSQISGLLGDTLVSDEGRRKAAALVRLRDKGQLELAELRQALTRKYGVPAGEVFELSRIQARIPPDAALVAWVDFAGPAKAHNPNGEHWLCVVRRNGAPNWVRLPGTGPNETWTADDEKITSRMRKACSNRPTEENDEREIARQLFTQRLAPAEKLFAATAELPAVRHLVVLPSPRMQRISTEVLAEAAAPGRFTVSYAPSGTMFAWLQEKRAAAERAARDATAPSILAVGDPVFAPVGLAAEPRPLPDHGIAVVTVAPNSSAAEGGLKPGDVLLQYDDKKLRSTADLQAAIEKLGTQGNEKGTIAIQVWRAGALLEQKVRPGPLGATPSERPAAEVVRAQRELDALMRHTSTAGLRRLSGAEREMQAVTGVFRTATVLKGSEASEQNLRKLAAEGVLGQFRYLHFATHGMLDTRSPMHSALILSQDRLPDSLTQLQAGRPTYDGRLTAEQILHGWRLDADLVTLSACETGLGKFSEGEGYLGFSQALFVSGARSLMLSLWQVDDASTELLMTRFYENLLARRPGLQKPMTKAEALAEAKAWLRGLKAEEVQQVAGGLVRGLDTETARGKRVAQPANQPGPAARPYPYAHPYYWAGFILLGDPN
jgi:CHAT domain-containing protein/tetratricopeptide (TPR) repeat protein